jgi:hypothetical protein
LVVPTLASVCAAEQLVPAGSVMQCTVNEPKLSSKTAHIGDPVLCTLGHVEKYGRSVFPYGSFLVGRFEDYKDPGHLVGKGWMELKFDRLEIPSTDTVVPVSLRVVSVPKYPVDNEGRIHGTGHPVKDTVEWMIPVLWPIDLINLPRRGPRPVLGPETQLTLKVMDDFGVPTQEDTRRPLLQARETQEPAPIERAYPQLQPQPQQYAAPVQQSYPAPVQQVAYPPMQQAQAAPTTVIYNNYAAPPQQQQAAPMVVHTPVQYRYMPPPPPYYRPYGYYPMY